MTALPPRSRPQLNQLEALDSLARDLVRRVRRAGPDFSDAVVGARRLHAVLRHLRAEVDDPDSRLAGYGRKSQDATTGRYEGELRGILEDSDFVLRQLEVLLDRYPAGDDGTDGSLAAGPLHASERSTIALVADRLARQKNSIDVFLDTVQLHSRSRIDFPPPASPPASSPHPPSYHHSVSEGMPPPTPRLDRRDVNLDIIKDKVDAIAEKLYRGRDPSNDVEEDEEELWQRFRAELEAEGFSKEVLRRNKDVLRAYIREMDASLSLSGGATPTVRGMLAQESHMHQTPYPYRCPSPGPTHLPQHQHQQHQYPSPVPPHSASPSVPNTSLFPNAHYNPFQYSNLTDESLQNLAFPPSQHNAPGPNDTLAPVRDHDNEKFALSIKDSVPVRGLRGLAKKEPLSPLLPPPKPMPYEDLRDGGGALRPFCRQNSERLSSSDDGYASDRSDSMTLISTRDLMAHMGNNALGISLGISQLRLPAPRQPHLLTYPERVHSPDATTVLPASPVPPPSPPDDSRGPSPLAPDNYGQEIPLDATWTRIKRSLISLEVLDHAGVRYEARPDFVAILGVLSREQIAYLARQSAECRAARLRQRYRRKAQDRKKSSAKDGTSSPSSSSSPDEDNLADLESDTTEDDEYVRREDRRSSVPGFMPVSLSGKGKEKEEQEKERDKDKGRGKDKGKERGKETEKDKDRGKEPEKDKDRGKEPEKYKDKEKTSPLEPRSVLKNKNENRVRWGPHPYEMDPDETGPKSSRHHNADSDRKRSRRRRQRNRSRDRDRDHHRDRDRDRERGRNRDTERHHRERRRRSRDKDYESDRDHSWERDRRHHAQSYTSHNSHSHSHSHNSHRRSTFADSTGYDRDRRESRKRAWGGTLGAVGIGGAAASLLSVLAEAAAAAF